MGIVHKDKTYEIEAQVSLLVDNSSLSFTTPIFLIKKKSLGKKFYQLK